MNSTTEHQHLHVQACNHVVLLQKRAKSKASKIRSQVPIASLMCIASSLFAIPVAEGFGISKNKVLSQSYPLISDVLAGEHFSRLVGVENFRHAPLRYRSHDNQEEQQSQHDQATAELAKQRRPNHSVSNALHTWWTAPKSRRAFEQAEVDQKERKEQEDLDQYLESLDRRYKRVHKDELKTSERSGVVSFMDWLTHNESVSQNDELRKQEDAIYVFGLAGVASKNLLKRRHLPIPESKRRMQLDNTAIIDIPRVEKVARSFSTIGSAPSTSTSVFAIIKTLPAARKRVKYAQSTMTAAVFFFQLLRTMRSGYSGRLATISASARSSSVMLARSSIKLLMKSSESLMNFAAMNGGSKYAIHFVSLLIACVSNQAFSIARSSAKPS